jgi:hypothetical protein
MYYQDFKDDDVVLHVGMRVQREIEYVLYDTKVGPKIRIIVKLQNLAYRKQVWVVATADRWETEHQCRALSYVTGPNKYGVEIWEIELEFATGTQDVEYAIKYECKEGVFWDNNCNRNYKVCLSTTDTKDHDDDDVNEEDQRADVDILCDKVVDMNRECSSKLLVATNVKTVKNNNRKEVENKTKTSKFLSFTEHIYIYI